MYFESLYIISGNRLSGIMSANNGALDISNAPGVSVCSDNAYFFLSRSRRSDYSCKCNVLCEYL